MLKKRLITASVLIPLVLITILFAPLKLFSLLAGAVMLLAAWEWTQFMKLTQVWQRLAYLLLIALLDWFVVGVNLVSILHLAVFWWIFATIWVLRYPRNVRAWSEKWFIGLLGTQLLVPCWFSLVYLRAASGTWVLCLLLLIWLVDSAAYFGGKKWGKKRLLPAVSPNKTWAGFWSGLAVAGVFGLLSTVLVGIDLAQWPIWLLFIVLTALIAIVGDLFESMLKRQCEIKDSGALIPGHGGILDRIDSLIAAAPFFALGLAVLGKI